MLGDASSDTGTRRSVAPASRSVVDVVAKQVRELRRKQGVSGSRLAEELSRRGIPWDRSTVTKLETGRRGSVTVPELFALAEALEVSPLALLVNLDDRSSAVFPAVETQPAALLWWLQGREPLPGTAAKALLPHPAADLVDDLAKVWQQVRWMERAADAAGDDEMDKTLFLARIRLRRSAAQMNTAGVAVPEQVADYLAEHPVPAEAADG